MFRTACTVALAGALLTGAGCGADRVTPPDPLRPFSAGGRADVRFPAAGLKFTAPADWTFDPGQAPLVATTTSGTATIAVWRYERSEPLPKTDGALRSAQTELERAAKVRDPQFALDRVSRVKVDGARGIQLTGTEHFGAQERRVRSTHVYAKGAEVVVDEYAAPSDFPLVDRTIFGPLIASLKIDPPTA